MTVSRAAGTMNFPAEFMLVAPMNPCPCGFHGDPKRQCRCTPQQVEKYRERISGPLLDSIDLHVEAPAVAFDELRSTERADASAAIRERVIRVLEIRRSRFGEGSKVRINARMSSKQVRKFCALAADAENLLRMAMGSLNLSARTHDRILKVARTISDLEGAENIAPDPIAEAIQYRTLDRKLWR
ncbi:MAG: ATP-binding protein [Chthoniobacteraceae bacterium]